MVLNSLGERQLVERAYVDEAKSKIGCICITRADLTHRPTDLWTIQPRLVAVAPDKETLEHTNKAKSFQTHYCEPICLTAREIK